tara:strand:+ start:919 stop:1140 length:222 start_codon:yes stop_codon:yes gene_type:complete
MTAWTDFLKKYAKDNDMKYNQAMKDPKARAAYNKSKGVKAGKKGSASKTDKGKENFTTKKGGMRKTARKAYEK